MPRSRARGPVAVLLLVLDLGAVGCSFEAKDTAAIGGLGAGSGAGARDGGVSVDRGYTNANTVPAGDACAANSFVANTLPPDLLIVLDRSGSMNDDTSGTMCSGGCGASSKWAQMTKAINQVVGKTEHQIRWGLKMFASGSDLCSVNTNAEVPIGPANAAAISTAIASATPGSATPTRAAETQAAAYLAGVQDPNPKYILLATDGLPNCQQGGTFLGADDTAAAAAVATVAAMGIPTFVVGIATGGSTADGTLNTMAVNGGRPRSASPRYYPVSTTEDLAAALTVIQGMVALPCQYQLGGVPSDRGGVSVSVGGRTVSMSEWTFGPGNGSIVFPDAGSICAQLKSGAIKDVRITLPCGQTIIP